MRQIVFLIMLLPVVCGAKVIRIRPAGEADRTAEVQRAISRMKKGDRLVFERGEYHFRADSAVPMTLYPSNNTGGLKHVIFPIEGKRGITIDGGGSRFVFYGRVCPFVVRNSRDVCLSHFTLTTRYPAAVSITVLSADGSGFTARIGSATRYEVDDRGNIRFSLGDGALESKSGRISLHGLDRINICYLMTPDAVGDKNEFPAGFVGVRARDLGDHTLRFDYYGDPHPKSIRMPYNVGEAVVLNLAEKRRETAFFFDSVRTLRVEDVNVRRFGGMAFVAQRCRDVTYERDSVMPEQGERVSVTADIFQCINCAGTVRIEGCTAGHSLDDVINIHGNYTHVTAVDGRRLTLRAGHVQHESFFPYFAGDSIEIIEPHGREVLARARVSSVQPSTEDHFVCTLEADRELSGVTAGSLVENITLCPAVVLRNNHFVDFPNIRLSGRGPMLYEHNTIERACTALVAMDLAEYWAEAGRFSSIVIRDNTFDHATALGGGNLMNFGVSGWGADAPKIHGRVLLSGNRYIDSPHAFSVAGVRSFTDLDAGKVK